jgi:hypothetical protein
MLGLSPWKSAADDEVASYSPSDKACAFWHLTLITNTFPVTKKLPHRKEFDCFLLGKLFFRSIQGLMLARQALYHLSHSTSSGNLS